jgi:hypothetical protein
MWQTAGDLVTASKESLLTRADPTPHPKALDEVQNRDYALGLQPQPRAQRSLKTVKYSSSSSLRFPSVATKACQYFKVVEMDFDQARKEESCSASDTDDLGKVLNVDCGLSDRYRTAGVGVWMRSLR